MKKLLNYIIDKNTRQLTVEGYLRSQGYSKNLIVHLKHTPMGITVGGQLVYTTHRLVSGETLTILLTENPSSEHIIPVPMDLDIVYEDEDLMIINKKAHVPIHPSQGHYNHTLANGIAYYYQQKGEPFVFRVINRLDRDTTGLLILAKHMLSACILSAMVKEHSIHREYLAIANGVVPQEGTINAPITRVNGSTIERCVDQEFGEYACTHYQTLEYHPDYGCSLVSLTLETGRTHQIRVHMKHIGHPLLGDFLYHPDYRLIERQALHSWKLEFHHPLTGSLMRYQAALPEDMRFLYSTIPSHTQPMP